MLALLWADTFVQNYSTSLLAQRFIKLSHPLTQNQYLDLSLPQDWYMYLMFLSYFMSLLLVSMDFSFLLLYNFCFYIIMTVEPYSQLYFIMDKNVLKPCYFYLIHM